MALRAFFNNYVRADYEAWLASPLNERLAMHAVASANIMAERVFHHWCCKDAGKLYHVKDEGSHRRELTARECPDFALVRDIADAHKHFALTRKPRRLTFAYQTRLRDLGCFGSGSYGEFSYGGETRLDVMLDDGTTRPLSAVMANVIVMWEQLLARWRL
jgi:hypothetical protein